MPVEESGVDPRGTEHEVRVVAGGVGDRWLTIVSVRLWLSVPRVVLCMPVMLLLLSVSLLLTLGLLM